MLSRRLVLATVVIAVVVASGIVAAFQFGGGSAAEDDPDEARIVQPGAPGEAGQELSEDDVAALDPPGHTPADAEFMRGMIHHHQQALDMTALVEQRHRSDDLPLLAERIEVSQTDEIALMEAWLRRRGEEVPDAESHQHNELMPGMLTTEQLRQLGNAQGAAFDRLFLERMISHHEGALVMVRNLYGAGGGLEPAIDRFARDVEADQAIEIRRMQELLTSLG